MNYHYLLGLLLLGSFAAQAQKKPLPPYQPTAQEVSAAYQRMARLDSLTKGTVYNMSVEPHWQPDGRSFWYRNVLRDSLAEYWYYDSRRERKIRPFDAQKLAVALTQATGQSTPANRLAITDLYFDPKNDSLYLEKDGRWYRTDTTRYALEKVPKPGFEVPQEVGWTRPRSRWWHPRPDSLSPDRQQKVFVRHGNVFIGSAKDPKKYHQLTRDGNDQKPYGELSWSPDGKYLVGYRINPQPEREVSYILTSLPYTTRGEVRTRGYAQPGDEFTSYEPYVFNLTDTTVRKVPVDVIDFFGPPQLRWREGGRYFTYEKVDRGHQRFRIIEVDAHTATARDVIDEKTETFLYERRLYTHYLPATREIIWSSERSGWRHLYLVNEATGQITNAITQGEWVVREVDSVDTKKREVWFRASGMNPGEDPYHVHYYRIGFDGKGLVRLTQANGTHQLTFSPDRTYYLDTYSRVDSPPVTELRRTADGTLLQILEKADATDYLALDLPLPTIFTAKGRDGQTDIWGIVYRPSRFDPKKRYPVIEYIYAGPHDAHVPKNFRYYGEMQSMAELGFILVQIDGMGTANRSKAFHDVCWQNLADAGFPDRIAWMKALAAKYPYVDTTRVGIYGTSAGGQNALGALLFHPSFYDAAVSACGCHDNRVDKQWWNEQWMGYPVGPHYEAQSNVTHAHKLRGDLLLIVGEADTNVPPESTYRVADELIKANKDFELLVVPGMGHSDGGTYGRRKKRDFFVKSLLGTSPPARNRSVIP
ncbi:S9 family peptidase [Rhabdobacter roseus]|uniref:Dipeptidyl aminopeptidase/acylaminoacyl peptidase n=1 Tax=Rhabdobacter roseus TaxID=1655419 RepID=A0A840TPY9_9BACT|nr:prolyl oligopeptidase family serine peptidase [Rhabdobacter roseus]MBB5283787.1 dipeptidyl aminopeptidase/acylaminoacyl peptidase [Rhabdobacter roseus]